MFHFQYKFFLFFFTPSLSVKLLGAWIFYKRIVKQEKVNVSLNISSFAFDFIVIFFWFRLNRLQKERQRGKAELINKKG